jgi:hypothetical protein
MIGSVPLCGKFRRVRLAPIQPRDSLTAESAIGRLLIDRATRTILSLLTGETMIDKRRCCPDHITAQLGGVGDGLALRVGYARHRLLTCWTPYEQDESYK